MEELEAREEKMETITELVEGADLFDSRGYAMVKVTKGGKEKPIRLPVKSTGVAEFMQELSGRAPKPPVTFEIVKKGSPEGRAAGLTHDQKMVVFDTTDEKYVDALEKHNAEFTWKVAVFALDLAWTRKDGSRAESYEDKKRILESNGITFNHINKIFRCVQDLTRWEEDRLDFLPGN